MFFSVCLCTIISIPQMMVMILAAIMTADDHLLVSAGQAAYVLCSDPLLDIASMIHISIAACILTVIPVAVT